MAIKKTVLSQYCMSPSYDLCLVHQQSLASPLTLPYLWENCCQDWAVQMTRNLCKLCFQVDRHLCSRNNAISSKPMLLHCILSQPWIAASFHNIPHNFKEATLVSFQSESDARLHIKFARLHIKQVWSLSNLSLHHTVSKSFCRFQNILPKAG